MLRTNTYFFIIIIFHILLHSSQCHNFFHFNHKSKERNCIITISSEIFLKTKNAFKKNKLMLNSEIILTIKGNNTQPILNDKRVDLYNYLKHGLETCHLSLNPLKC